MTAGGDIWLADLARAVTALHPSTAGAASEIAGLLGFAARKAPSDPGQVKGGPGGGAPGSGSSRTVVTDAKTPIETRSERPLPSLTVLTPLRTEPIEPSERWHAVAELEPPGPRHQGLELPHLPLFEPRWQRELAVALAAELLPMGQIDTQRLVGRAARSLPLTTIPRRRRWSVSRGLRVLMDLGPGGEPFRRDQALFGRLLESVLGRERVEIAGFHGCPSRGLITDDGDCPYRPPAPGSPVLVMGEMGFGPGELNGLSALPGEWLDLAQSLRQQGSRLVALTTGYVYPREITDAVTVIPWRRSTTQRIVHEAMRRT